MTVYLLVLTFIVAVIVIWQLRGVRRGQTWLDLQINLAYLYCVLSIITGPALLLLPLNHPSGFDCQDPSWGATTLLERDELYRHAGEIMEIGAAIAIGIGAILMINMLLTAQKARQLRHVLVPIVGMLSMVLGYMLVMFFGSNLGCSL